LLTPALREEESSKRKMSLKGLRRIKDGKELVFVEVVN